MRELMDKLLQSVEPWKPSEHLHERLDCGCQIWKHDHSNGCYDYDQHRHRQFELTCEMSSRFRIEYCERHKG